MMIILALVISVLAGIIGFAVDLSMQRNAEHRVQSALDAAGLAAMKAYALDNQISDVAMETVAQEYFEQIVADIAYATMQDLDMTKTDAVAEFTVEGQMPTTISRMLGQTSLPLSARTEITYRKPTRMDIALVLDTSGSMNNMAESGRTSTDPDTGEISPVMERKIHSLREAAKDMVNNLVVDGSDDVKFSVVPFSGFISVGMDNADAWWLDIEEDRRESTAGSCVREPAWTEANCELVEFECGADSQLEKCERHDCSGVDTPSDKWICGSSAWIDHHWHGCVRSRPAPYNAQDAFYESHPIPGIVTPDFGTCASPIKPLSSDAAELWRTIRWMRMNGETYIPSGLIWGMRTLTNRAPYREGGSLNSFKQSGDLKTLILMSDGENTISALADGTHEGTDRAAADALTLDICSDIRSKSVTIYTIAFGVSDPATKTLLEDCAGSSSRYFDASDGAQLLDAFKSIREQLAVVLAVTG